MFLGQFAVGNSKFAKKKARENDIAIYSFFDTGRNLVVFWGRRYGLTIRKRYFAKRRNKAGKRYTASFSIEATMVLGVVFMTVAWLIRYAYVQHDEVTGTMILQEMIVNGRMLREEEMLESDWEELGTDLGNPRLWLGDYELEIEMENRKIVGKAYAGDWKKEMEIETFRPGDFLRRTEGLRALTESGEMEDDNGS